MPKKPARWVLPSILLGIYLFLKLQGFLYARAAAGLERQLDELRPALSTKALYEQLDLTRQAYTQASEKIGRMDLKGDELLRWLSEHLPASMTLSRVRLNPDRELQMEGVLLPGVRDPEAVLVGWARQLQKIRPRVRVLSFSPSVELDGAWNFQLEGLS